MRKTLFVFICILMMACIGFVPAAIAQDNYSDGPTASDREPTSDGPTTGRDPIPTKESPPRAEEPKDESKDKPKDEPKADPKVEPKADPKPEPKPEPKDEPKDDPKPEPKADPKPEPKVDPKVEPKAKPPAPPNGLDKVEVLPERARVENLDGTKRVLTSAERKALSELRFEGRKCGSDNDIYPDLRAGMVVQLRNKWGDRRMPFWAVKVLRVVPKTPIPASCMFRIWGGDHRVMTPEQQERLALLFRARLGDKWAEMDSRYFDNGATWETRDGYVFLAIHIVTWSKNDTADLKNHLVRIEEVATEAELGLPEAPAEEEAAAEEEAPTEEEAPVDAPTPPVEEEEGRIEEINRPV